MRRGGLSTVRASTARAVDRPVTRLGRLALVVLGGVAAAGALAAPAIEVEPPEALEGQRVVVRLAGLAPGQPVTLHAARLFDRYPTGQEAYRGRATFVAGADGRIDTARDAPTAESSYAGVDPAGLFWSMAPLRRAPARASDSRRPRRSGDARARRRLAGARERRPRRRPGHGRGSPSPLRA